MADHSSHELILKELREQFAPVFEHSQQGIYIYLDDIHKACNATFAEKLGYGSPREWADVKESFPMAFVADESQDDLISAYQHAMETFVGARIAVTWKKKSGAHIKSDVILVPVPYKHHVVALHFVSF
jgi:hypothetical protein